MTDQPFEVEPSDVMFDRLRAARRARGLTQQDVADRIGMARTTLVAIEKGERPVRPQEIIELARLYDRPLNELLRAAPVAEDFVAQFRLRTGGATQDEQLAEAVELLQELADDYVELERLAGAPLPQRYPPEIDISALTPAAAGETLAAGERNRLGLGDAPAHHLRQTLESDVGLRIFFLPLPSRVAGLFVASAAYGACIGINAGHPGERQRWSLTHEYAHFLTQRSRTEVTVLHGYQRVPTAERFADAFAENFLLPASGVKRRFHEVRQSRRDGVTPADLLHLADLFQVSLEALVRRLENLDLVRSHTWDLLVKQGFRVGEARKMLELAALPPDTELLPLRYRYMAVEAYLEGDISEGQFARFLRTDRTTARGLAQQLSHRIGMDETGAVSEEKLGYLEGADVAIG
jgi:Zn-dependent peptidase ImmA (M78 family)/transcriptional regulator with XRE-family HTH domain